MSSRQFAMSQRDVVHTKALGTIAVCGKIGVTNVHQLGNGAF